MHTSRFLSVTAAWQARNTAHMLRKMGHTQHAEQAWKLVKIHLALKTKGLS